MDKYVLVHELRLPHQSVQYKYEVTDITEEYIETKEIGKLPMKYISKCGSTILVNNSSIFYLENNDTQERAKVIQDLKSQLFEYLRIRSQYCDEIENIEQKISNIDIRIKDISSEMNRIAEGGTLDVK